LPRDDAARWSKKVRNIIRGSLKPEEEEKRARDEEYHRKMLDRIAGDRKQEPADAKRG
jgi:hypothetical protein